MKKFLGIFIVLLLVAGGIFVYYRFFFVFGEGVKSGELNYVVYKGVVFKTYEGKLIQSGIRSKTAGSVQSYEFEFSVDDEELARELMLQSGKTLELHYKEYFGALPWRGFTKFIVDSIIVKPTAGRWRIFRAAGSREAVNAEEFFGRRTPFFHGFNSRCRMG